MIEVFKRRPFKTRNADEYNLSDILTLFVNPINGLSSPLEFENTIIKGKMGSGKTMFLRANYAFYLYNIVPRLIENEELILPVFIKLSDFQHIKESSGIYKEVIISIIEQLCSVYLKLQDAKEMANIHFGMKRIPSDVFFDQKIKQTTQKLLQLGSEEYMQRINTEFNIDGKVKYSFFEMSSSLKNNKLIEIKKKNDPGIKDIVQVFETLLSDSDGKILLLIDEAGALDRNFFKSDNDDSAFEILMNQLRTCDFIRTKIAVYPNSFSDILTETRYGDIVSLEENIDNINSYNLFRSKVYGILSNYININQDDVLYKYSDVFEVNDSGSDCLEQIINGSGGNFRRLIQLLDSAMNESYKVGIGLQKVQNEDAIKALKNNCEGTLNLYTDIEKEYLNTIAKVCKGRSTYRFQFPNNSIALNKYLTKSQEYNLLKIIDAGSGRKGTTYAFDYSYCVLQDIPTHYIKNTEKIDKARTHKYGEWITRVTTVNSDLIAQSQIIGKIDGELSFKGENGWLAIDEVGVSYYLPNASIIKADQRKTLHIGKKVRFYPSKLGNEGTLVAFEVEIL